MLDESLVVARKYEDQWSSAAFAAAHARPADRPAPALIAAVTEEET